MTLPVPLTEPEKVRIRHHLGFMAVTQASTFSLGTPASLETQFIIEGALKNIPGESLDLIRSLIARCDGIEEQIGEDTENLAVLKIGSIQLNDHELADLMERYDYWRMGLANALGIVANPYDKRSGLGGGGGLNIPVRG
jgi:hypothetical protein